MDVLMDATAGLEAKNGTEIITANATYRDLNPLKETLRNLGV